MQNIETHTTKKKKTFQFPLLERHVGYFILRIKETSDVVEQVKY